MSQIPPRSRSELEHAEAEYKKRLEIEEKLGRKEGMAVAYGNLGSIYLTVGHLDQAEEMEAQAAEIETKGMSKKRRKIMRTESFQMKTQQQNQ